MRTLFIAAVSALFFAALVTELTRRLWPDDYFALLLLTFVALLLSGLLNLRLAGLFPAATAQRPAPRGERREPARERGTRAGRGGNGRGRAPAKAQRPRPEPAPASAGPRESGTVKWFNRTKGFGFVIRESGEEIFVHQRSIRATGDGDQRRRPALHDGQKVTFVVADREKGLQAEDVVPADQD